ncbi:MAG: Fur family transcriptional regulator [Pseudomonadota bacterium]
MAIRSETMQKRVLSVLKRRARPASAYAVLDELRGEHPKLAPATVYRALSALTENGYVHRVESINAFIARQTHADVSTSILSICDDCGVVEETVSHNLIADLSRLMEKSGFSPQHHVIEVHGQCESCCGNGGAE